MIKYEFKKGSAAYVDIAATYKVRVEKSEGIIGKPSLKSVESFDWKYLHGTTPDLRNRRYQNKEITLTCWMTAESKQKMVEDFNAFVGFFAYDNLLLMKTSWDGNDGHGSISPDPHASKGIYSLVYLKSVGNVEYRYRFGRQVAKFKLTFVDPYPVKQVLLYTGTESDGVDYAITSDTEIDIFASNGASVYDVRSGSGHIVCSLNSVILVCGDVPHATTSHASGRFIDPTSNRDTVTVIYSEI